MSIRTYNRGEVIFRQGEYASEMYDILSGGVAVYTAYGTEHENQLTILKPGQFLGEMGLIEAYPRSATAVADEDGTQLMVVDAKEYSSYFSDRPERLLQIMRHISNRLRDLTEDYDAACRIRDEMLATQKAPETRKQTLLEKIKSFLEFYNECLKNGDLLVPDEDIFIPYSHRRF